MFFVVVFSFVLYLAALIAEFAVLFDGKYCIIFLIILPLLKHKNIPAHQLFGAYTFLHMLADFGAATLKKNVCAKNILQKKL